MTKTKPTEDDTMRVLATGTCETLSGSSKLTYHIGSTPEAEIHLRVHSNIGGGFFSQEWIALDGILQALKKRPEGKPITSILLHPLFKGKSVNTPAFLLAVLLHEKLVRSMQGKLRRHELMDTSAFMAKVDRLLRFTRSGIRAKHVPCNEFSVMWVSILKADDHGSPVTADSLGKQRRRS
jgi:hypothetical protein